MLKKVSRYAVRFTVAPARASQEMAKDHQPTATPFMVIPLDR